MRGSRFHFRLFALVAQIRPLTIFLFRHGVVKLDDMSLMTFNEALLELERQGVQLPALKLQFRDIIIKCLLSMHQELMHSYNQVAAPAKGATANLLSDCCFELLEFKLIVDAQHKVWLIGVKQSPNYNNVDQGFARSLLLDTLRLVDVVPPAIHFKRQICKMETDPENALGLSKLYQVYCN